MILLRQSLVRLGLAALLALALLLAFPGRTAAHDIPSRVTVFAFVVPQGRTLRMVIRVPLEAMRDVNFPLSGPGYLDVAASAPLVHDAAKVWLADEVQLYEGDVRLGAPSITATHVSLPSDRSFADFRSALEHTLGPPLPPDTQLMWKQAMLDVILEYPIASDRS
ncbi:MAG TPA: hypothetical protein VII52_06430, partial [Gemmatimonadaceae bacterium]